MMRTLRTIPVVLAACALAQAQQTTLVIPPSNASNEASTLRWAAGTETALRQQWLVDAASLSPLVGRSCHDPAVVAPLDGGRTHRVSEDDLIVGTTVTSFAFATPGAVAFLLFGLSPLTTPIPLDAAGAPGCTLDTLAFTNMPGRVVSVPPGPILPRAGGVVTEEFTLPGWRTLLGSRFVLQWAELGGSGLRTTNAAGCDVASALPSLGVVLVEARIQGQPVPTQGRVERHAIPVIRITGS